MAFGWPETYTLLTLSAPLLATVAALVAWLWRLRRGRAIWTPGLGWLTRLLSFVSLVSSILLAGGQIEGSQVKEFHFSIFYLDALSLYFVLLVNLVAFFASWYTVDFLRHDARYGQEHHQPELFHLFFNFFHLTMLLVPMVDNLILLWIAIELTTLTSTMLVRYHRRRPSIEAAWKYIIITTAGIVFALLGTIFLAKAVTDETCLAAWGQFCQELSGLELMAWSKLAQEKVAPLLKEALVIPSFLFILLGYGTKAGFAPMHTWLPDGHGEAPSPVSALLSGVLLKSALYAILRFYTITNLNNSHHIDFTSPVLLVTGLLSLLLAVPLILKTNKFKRVLAYHSLEHMGIIAFGIGINSWIALYGALLHALNHALTKAFMFLVYGYIQQRYAEKGETAELDSSQMVGILRGMPMSGLLLLFGGLGLVGAPPFNIFFSEFIILRGAFSRLIEPDSPLSSGEFIFLGLAEIIFLLALTLIFAGLVGHLSRLLLDHPPFENILENGRHLWPLFLLLGLIIAFGLGIPPLPIDFHVLLERSADLITAGANAGGQP